MYSPLFSLDMSLCIIMSLLTQAKCIPILHPIFSLSNFAAFTWQGGVAWLGVHFGRTSSMNANVDETWTLVWVAEKASGLEGIDV